MKKNKMNTFKLACQYSAVEKVKQKSNHNHLPHAKKYDYLLVLDFEATCWNKSDSYKGKPEIIEFPVVLYDVKRKKIASEFQQYVRPTENPHLTDFCTELTGIRQNQIDFVPNITECLVEFHKWLDYVTLKHSLVFLNANHKGVGGLQEENAIFVTWSDWDIGICLRKELKRKGLPMPDVFLERVDLKKVYSHYYGRPSRLNEALVDLGMTFEGRQHCGLDDARNTAKLAERLLELGARLFPL